MIIVVLWEASFLWLIAVSGSVALFLAVKAFAFFEQLLVFGGHGVNVYGIRVSVSGRVLVVSVLFRILVVLGSASHCSHKVSPVIVE